MIVQEPFAGTVTLDIGNGATEGAAPATIAEGIAVVQVPRPAPMKFWLTLLIARLAGKVAVNVPAVSVTGFGLVMVKTIVDTPFTAITDGTKLFAIVGGPRTARKAVEDAPAVGVCVLVAPLVV